MVAFGMPNDGDGDQADEVWPDPADWLPLQEAACELGLSPATLRRMIRRGQVRNRIVPRPGGIRFLVYLPGSRHARMRALAPARAPAAARRRLRLVEGAPAGPWRSDLAEDAPPATGSQRLQSQLDHLSRALSRALAIRQAVPPGAPLPGAADPDEPFGRYRWLARRRRRWWHFS